MTTRVDFYVLADTRQGSREHMACRVTEKAWRNNHRVYVYTESPDAARRFDEQLWTFRQSSFVPHEICTPESGDDVPVLIGHGPCPTGINGVLVNLGQQVPDFYSRFERVVELIATDDDARRVGRERWRQYKERGCAIQSHNV